MRTEPAQGPQEPGKDRKPNVPTTRPARTGESGPLGFGSVMRDVRGAKARGREQKHESAGDRRPGKQPAKQAARRGDDDQQVKEGGPAAATVHPVSGASPVAAPAVGPMMPPVQGGTEALDPGLRAALEMGAIQTTEQHVAEASFGVQDASQALASRDASVAHASQAEPLVPTQLVRMTPAALVSTVVDEATKHAIDEASRELHVELEPAHLGPLVVRLMRGPDGRLDVRFRARQADAARVLDGGLELLRERLADAGFAGVTLHVEHDGQLVLGRPA